MTVPSETPLAVITGASSGIGYALAEQFATNGFDVVIAAEDEELRTAAESLGAHGRSVLPVRCDLATERGVEQLCAAIAATGRPVDSLALNAGVGVGGPFVETDLRAELNLLALNITSPVVLAKRLLPDMVARGHGRVLFTSSIAATAPGPFYATYAASKAFLYSLSESIRDELKGTGVTVTALMPGPTDTEFFARAGMEDTRAGETAHKDDPADVAERGFKALMAGKHHVVAASFVNKAMVASGRLMPEPAKAAMQRRLTEPGKGDDDKDRNGRC
ncbi:oxidoreductase [Virgisporangium aliadipatigenens]|uniref:Oxidoreductase n=1 Tax=Virgisporangium aliadipatigenens TaxID=741659 RepID=A0A8J3YER4_9ACTN|nr:SDR family NAD(P)-dependent oxidoreductase [Virgisporangium aliadipatigenens]GIJ43666.1 oxidoreductase [Virgisporangium aliadipatigenens]